MSPALRFCFVVLAAMIACRAAVAATPPSERAKVEGFAVVRVIYNGVTSYDDIVIERVDGKRRKAYLSGPIAGIDTPTTYAGWLDPGTYRCRDRRTDRGSPHRVDPATLAAYLRHR